MSRARRARRSTGGTIDAWIWAGCGAVLGFTLGTLLSGGEGYVGIVAGGVAGLVAFAVRRPRTLRKLAETFLDVDDDETSWGRMRRREILRRRREAARVIDARIQSGPPGQPVRRRARFPRWRRKYRPDGGGGADGFWGGYGDSGDSGDCGDSGSGCDGS